MPTPHDFASELSSELITRLAKVAPITPNMVYLLDSAGKIEWVNPAFEQCTGYRLEDAVGRLPSELILGPGSDPDTIAMIRRKIFQGEPVEADLLNYTRSGRPFWVHVYCAPLDDEGGRRQGFMVIQNNVSDLKSSERSLRIAASVFDRSHEAIVISDHHNRILDVNPAFSRITGYSRDEVLGLTPAILSSGRHSPDYYRSMWRSIEKTDHWRGEIWNRRKNGEEYVELLSISRVHLDEPGQFYYVAAFSDITTLKNHAKELDLAANYDELTGLPNRHLLEERLRAACAHADRQQNSVSVCCLDLDGFKEINHRLGHAAGNQALRAIADRLTNTLRSGDIVARTGGDEFFLVLQDNNHDEVYQRILEAISSPFELDGETIQITGSLGITRYPEDDTDAEGLIRHADQAMYSAKEKGRNQQHIFDPGLDEYRRKRRHQLTEVTRALENQEFELYFQPQVRGGNSRLIGFEALIRWNHPVRGLLAPGQFLPMVENSHLEVPLGQWVVKEAIHQLNTWKEAGEDFEVGINISAQHLMDPSFAHYVESYLQSHPDLDPAKITLEVLESTALEDTKRASNVLARCRELGLQVALDDFGTGFSSLTYLRTLPVDIIKIDQSFVRNMLDNPNDRAIVESVIFLAQRFSRPALAEGVETTEHAQALRDMGCHLLQGYGIARPMPASQVLSWAQDWRANGHQMLSDSGAGPG